MEVRKLASINQYNIQSRNSYPSFNAAGRRSLPFKDFVCGLLEPQSILTKGCEYADSDFVQHIIRLSKERSDQMPIFTRALNVLNNIFENRMFGIDGENIWDVEILKNSGGEFFSYRIFPNGHIADIQRNILYTDESSKFKIFDFVKRKNRRFRLENLNVNEGIQCNLYGKTKANGSTIMVSVDRYSKTGRLKSIEKTVSGWLASVYVPHTYYKDSSGSIKIKRMFGDYLGTFYEEDGSYYVFKKKSDFIRRIFKSEGLNEKPQIDKSQQKRSDLTVELYNEDGILHRKGVVVSDVNIVDEIMRLRTSGRSLKDWLLDNVAF